MVYINYVCEYSLTDVFNVQLAALFICATSYTPLEVQVQYALRNVSHSTLS